MKTLLEDLGHAVRGLRHNRGFTFVATLTIALGIGACTAIFSVVNAVLLRPLPYASAERLVLVWGELRARQVRDWPFSPPDFRDLQLQATAAFEGLAGVAPTNRVPLSDEAGDAELVRAAGATPNLFRLLGARIALGRDFVDDDAAVQAPTGEAVPGMPPPRLPQIAILSHAFWRRRYGGDPSIIGRQIDLRGGRAEIVGVLAPDFELLLPPRANVDHVPDLWTALRIDYAAANRNNVLWRVIGRTKPGVSLEQADRAVDRIGADLRGQFPIKQTSGLHFRAVSMYEDLVGDARPAIVALMGAVVFVLLIACANVANLLAVRASGRGRELAVRAAIGASRPRLVRQMLAESLVIAFVGTALGVVLARAGIHVLLAVGPATLPRLDGVGMDPTVLAFAAAAGAVTALVCGIVPALRASRSDVVDALRTVGGRACAARGGRRLRGAIVMTEVALTCILLAGAGLMLRSVIALSHVDPGYDPDRVLTFLLRPQAREPEQRSAFMRQVRERLLAIPGVVGVTAATSLPLDGATGNARWGTEAAIADPSTFRQADRKHVLPGYFETLRTRLVAGRFFTEADDEFDGPDAPRQLIIDESLAARAFPKGSAIGRRLLVRTPNNPEPEWWEVIGVVAHQRHVSLAFDGPEALFLTDGRLGHGAAGRWAVRTTGDPSSYVPAVRAAVAAVDPRAPLGEVQPMMALVDRAMAPIRFTTTLIGIFAVVAMLLAAVGLYGVVSTIVLQRTPEIGMRMVCGAPRASILGLVVGEGLKMGAIGIGIGLAGAWAVTRVMASLLVGVTPTDPATFGGIVVLFAVIATAASWLPARRASRLDPMDAIRGE